MALTAFTSVFLKVTVETTLLGIISRNIALQ